MPLPPMPQGSVRDPVNPTIIALAPRRQGAGRTGAAVGAGTSRVPGPVPVAVGTG